jgi:hypothetical protein
LYFHHVFWVSWLHSKGQPQPGKIIFINQPARNVMFATRTIKTSIAVLALALFTVAPASKAAAPAASGQVLASSDGEKTGLSVEVTELKRGSGGTVTLKFEMVNNTKEKFSLGGNYGAGGGNVDDYTVSGTHLIDAVNKKKYLVVRDSEKKCVCSKMDGYIQVGERGNLWAKFPAPPQDVKVISVMIPHFAPMDDVPISP